MICTYNFQVAKAKDVAVDFLNDSLKHTFQVYFVAKHFFQLQERFCLFFFGRCILNVLGSRSHMIKGKVEHFNILRVFNMNAQRRFTMISLLPADRKHI